jgi:hypothetical protein
MLTVFGRVGIKFKKILNLSCFLPNQAFRLVLDKPWENMGIM